MDSSFDLSLIQSLLVTLVLGVGVVVGGFVNLYFTFKNFATVVMEKAVPEELVDETVKGIDGPWKKWFASSALTLLRSKLIDWVFRIVTAPKQAAGIAIRVVVSLIGFVLVCLVNFLTSYFGEMSILVVGGTTFVGMVVGWFTLHRTVGYVLEVVIRMVTERSTAAIKGAASMVGKKALKATSA